MGQTAERLLELLEEYGGDEKKILEDHRELEYFYALSDIRENLLEWFPFDPNGRILQIGSGCGALTGLLSRRGKQVTVIDGDETDLKVNRIRRGALGNIDYVNCNLGQYMKQAGDGRGNAADPFDCVVMADGLGETPEESIEVAKAFVKPGGSPSFGGGQSSGLKALGRSAEGDGSHRKRAAVRPAPRGRMLLSSAGLPGGVGDLFRPAAAGEGRSDGNGHFLRLSRVSADGRGSVLGFHLPGRQVPGICQFLLNGLEETWLTSHILNTIAREKRNFR